MSRYGYVYNNLDAGLYAALAPIGWCLFFAWIIFISHIGYGGQLNFLTYFKRSYCFFFLKTIFFLAGIVGKILSSEYCTIWTRLSYAVYLTQFPVYFFNVGMQRAAQPYSFFLMVSVIFIKCYGFSRGIQSEFFNSKKTQEHTKKCGLLLLQNLTFVLTLCKCYYPFF